jgi:hypothetical protein
VRDLDQGHRGHALALGRVQEARRLAELQTEALRIKTEVLRGLWTEVAITSQVGTDMADEEVFEPARIQALRG